MVGRHSFNKEEEEGDGPESSVSASSQVRLNKPTEFYVFSISISFNQFKEENIELKMQCFVLSKIRVGAVVHVCFVMF